MQRVKWKTWFPALAALTCFLIGCGANPASSGGTPVNVTVKTFALTGGAQIDMVQIAPGIFLMGSPGLDLMRGRDEGPPHLVTISQGFYLGKYEVTQGEWERVMGTRPWQGMPLVTEGPDYPAVYVSWWDAQAFIGKLNAAAGDSVYRLPTEAEWEYACRAGTMTLWSCGSDMGQLSNFAWYYSGRTDISYPQKVGGKKPNPWGLYDVHGNVREWVYDWYEDGYYNNFANPDPKGPDTGTERAVRGGYWRDDAQYVRSANRFHQTPDERDGLIGFRLLRMSP